MPKESAKQVNSFIHKKKKVHLLMPDEVQYLHFNNENIINVQFSVCYTLHNLSQSQTDVKYKLHHGSV